MTSRALKITAVAALCVGLTACSTVRNAWPFGRDDGPRSRATEGERVSIIQFDQRLEANEALAGVGFQLPEARAVTEWSVPGGNPEQAVEHVSAAPAFEVAWRRDIGEGSKRKSQITATPVAAQGKIFTLDGEARVTATDARTGARVWSADLNPRIRRDRDAFGGGLAYADGKVFVSSGFRFVAALDATNGAQLWKAEVSSPIHAAPTASGGRIFVTDVDNQIIAFNQADGQQAWSYQALVEPARILKASSPAVAGDSVIAPFSSGELIAIRAFNGNPVWSETLARASRTNALSEIRDIAGRPAVYRGDVYAVSHSGVFAAVDLRTGARKWELPIASTSSPWPAGDVVYVVSLAGELAAVNRDSGQAYWVRDLNDNRSIRKTGGTLGFGRRESPPVWTGPVLADNRLVMVNSYGEAVALDATTGEVQKTIRLGAPAYIAPIAVDGMLYVVTDEGQLVAIR